MTAVTFARAKLPSPDRATPRAIARWLLAICLLVMAMVVVGGITRLTESGLSMTRWEPQRLLPPMDMVAWQTEFARYRQSPEYLKINAGMGLAAFQGIYYWEYAHRLLGRAIGVAFALPLLWFWLRRAIPGGFHGRLLALLLLGGMQGVVGWWMVASGLVNRPDVSHYRLAMHLLLALAIFAACLWTALDLLGWRRSTVTLRPWTLALGGALLAQLTLGAFTAGLNAGHASNIWPMMEPGRFLPRLANPLLDDPAGVQFLHRLGAYAVVALALACAWRTDRTGDPALAGWGRLLALVALVQTALGIATIVTGVPVWLAGLHQFTAVLFLATFTCFAHRQFTSGV
jgi:heme a synthase